LGVEHAIVKFCMGVTILRSNCKIAVPQREIQVEFSGQECRIALIRGFDVLTHRFGICGGNIIVGDRTFEIAVEMEHIL